MCKLFWFKCLKSIHFWWPLIFKARAHNHFLEWGKMEDVFKDYGCQRLPIAEFGVWNTEWMWVFFAMNSSIYHRSELFMPPGAPKMLCSFLAPCPVQPDEYSEWGLQCSSSTLNNDHQWFYAQY
jgi:hypothetical protein